jgi:hypothetical protein
MESKTMIATIIAALIAFVCGMAADYFRQWSAIALEKREVRKTVRAELHAIVCTINFFLMRAAHEGGETAAMAEKYFCTGGLRLDGAFQGSPALRLYDRVLLNRLNGMLGELGTHQDDAFFKSIMILESLTIEPLNAYPSAETARFIRGILERPEIVAAKAGRFQLAAESAG